MFQSLRKQWREARGDGLRKEFEDAVLRLKDLGIEVNRRALMTMILVYKETNDHYGEDANISNEEKLNISKELISKAKGKFKYDMGGGYGLALLSMYFESQALPGSDARFVEQSTRELLGSANSVVRQLMRRPDHA